MANIFLILFLLLFGVIHLVATKIPDWVLGVSAVVAGIALIAGAWNKKP